MVSLMVVLSLGSNKSPNRKSVDMIYPSNKSIQNNKLDNEKTLSFSSKMLTSANE